MSATDILICCLVGFTTAFLVVPAVLWFGRRSGLSQRTRHFHQTHREAVPRLGGLALAAAFLAVVITIRYFTRYATPQDNTHWIIIIGSLAMFAVGFWDDLNPLGARRKLLLQVLVAVGVYSWGLQIEQFRNPFTGTEYFLGPWGLVTTVFWLVAMTNLVNLVDGIDGLAGGIAFMLMCLLAYVGLGVQLSFPTLVAIGMAGACIGFLCFNFPPAKVYLGDGGAYFLGFLIAVLSIANAQKGTVAAALIAPVFALALPIADVVIAILRRGLKGLPVFRADRKHLHHRLVAHGFSRRRTVLLLYVLSLVFLIMAFGVFWSRGQLVPLLFGFACLTLILSARSFSFSREWFSVGKVLGNSLEMRKETRYALALGQWFELEAERCPSVEVLWTNFHFVVHKLGFTEATVRLGNRERSWQAEPATPDAGMRRIEFDLGQGMTIQLAAPGDGISEHLFEMLGELAAESWAKGTQRWHATTQLPIEFLSPHSGEGNPVASQARSVFFPSSGVKLGGQET